MKTEIKYLTHFIKGIAFSYAPAWLFRLFWKRYGFFAQASDLRKTISPQSGLASSAGKKRVLVFSPRWWPVHTAWECTIARALADQGHTVALTACGKAVPVCEAMTLGSVGKENCFSCPHQFDRFIGNFELPVLHLSSFVSERRRKEITGIVSALNEAAMFSFTHNGFSISEIIGCSMARQFRALNWEHNHENISLYRDYLAAAAILAESIPRLFDEFKPDSILLANGKFHAEAIVMEVARKRGVKVITYERGNIRDTMTFAIDRPTVPLDFSAGWKQYENVPLSEAERTRLYAYLDKRKVVGNGMIPFYDSSINEDEQMLMKELKLDPNRKTYVLFSNTIWDSAVYQEDKAFPNMFAWIERAIRHFARHPERQLIIRVHPAEVRVHWQMTKEKVVDYLNKVFSALPQNVTVIPPESNISSYTLMKIADAGLVYSSTVGVEMALLGKPVITAANSNYGEKGFTCDSHDPEEFDALVETMPLNIDLKRREKAEILAYMMYFQYMVPFPFLHETPEHWNFSFMYNNFSELKTIEMDRICKSITSGEPLFIQR